MRIGIHNEPSGGGLGGSEVCVAVLAEALAKNHEVEILHHRTNFVLEDWSRFANVNLSNVRLRIPQATTPLSESGSYWSRYRAERNEHAAWSRGYDLFINFVHNEPAYCAAPIGVLAVLFPFLDFNESLYRKNQNQPAWKGRLRVLWQRWKWRARIHSYQIRISISDFTRRWTKRRWNFGSQVIYPPVDVHCESAEKANHILSVGRFAVTGHLKKQIEMLEEFGRLKPAAPTGWQYDCAGGCGTSKEELNFLKKATYTAAETGATIHANVSVAQLKQFYQRSKIFWHAAGMDADENRHPELTEHFGITTVEAMAASCVPVVINKGGQSEIIEHGVSGFLWDTPEEWHDYTLRLMRNNDLLQRMSVAARERASHFGREAYVARFTTMLSPHLESGSRHPAV